MRSFKVLFSTAILTAAFPAMASDINTYRSGNAYLKTPAPGAQACEAQCSGDAQCKGWNFLRSGAPNGAGICEFNNQISSIIAHPYAISGDASSQAYAGGTLVQGQTRTTRIGQPVTVRPQIKPHTQQASTRPIKRQVRRIPAPVTRQRQFAPHAVTANNKPIVQRSDLRKPPTLGGPLQQVRPNAPVIQRQIRRQVQSPAQPAAQAPRNPNAPRIYGGPASQQATQAINARAPKMVQARAPRPEAPQARRPMPPRQPQAPVRYEDALQQSNLYGSLYDNVAKKPAAPKAPLYNERPKDDPDAPMTTSVAVPTAKVSEDVLAMAGAAPR